MCGVQTVLFTRPRVHGSSAPAGYATIKSYMKSLVRLALQTSPEQRQRFLALQSEFSQVCNALAPTARDARCWNRVALHHMTYKSLREQFPALGSQMVCNAIYAVCRACRQVYQHPHSPFNLSRLGARPLPLLRFADNSPVYFDRHTLSMKAGVVSIYTLEGRMRFQLKLRSAEEEVFHQKKIREILLSRRPDGEFELVFWLEREVSAMAAASSLIPRYVQVEEGV